MNCFVSCVIPTYERPELLVRAVKSIINQTYEGIIEIVIVDNSKLYDNSIEKTQRPGNRLIQYIWQEGPIGASVARNMGIEKSHGEFIAFLDDDDEWLPTKIEKQMGVMETHHDCPIVICWSLDERLERLTHPPKRISHKMILRSFNLASTSTYLVRRYPLELYKGFDASLQSSQEYDLAIRLSENHDILCVQEPLIIQHTSKDQISSNWKRKIKGTLGIFQKHHKEYKTKDYIKTLGLLALFSLGFVLGRRVYKIIVPLKEKYDKS
jgi:glycosyltransferase involved in cell wall biosynthesis